MDRRKAELLVTCSLKQAKAAREDHTGDAPGDRVTVCWSYGERLRTASGGGVSWVSQHPYGLADLNDFPVSRAKVLILVAWGNRGRYIVALESESCLIRKAIGVWA